jgi:hypothetical protein
VLARAWPELEAGWVGAGARRSQENLRRDGRATTVEVRATEDERRMGSTSPWAALFIGGPPNLSVTVPSTVQHASMALFREVREKIKVDFSLTDYSYDLNLSLGRQINNKTTSGRLDGKHVLQAPTSH